MTIEVPVDLFDRLMDFMEWEHTATFDPKFVGETVKSRRRDGSGS
jgi:hypothetical protein